MNHRANYMNEKCFQKYQRKCNEVKVWYQGFYTCWCCFGTADDDGEVDVANSSCVATAQFTLFRNPIVL
mgnify:CR=1 FL=1